MCLMVRHAPAVSQSCAHCFCLSANKKELVTDLMVKAKQVEYLINSLPEPEPEEAQVSSFLSESPSFVLRNTGRPDDLVI